jgi:membrane protein required for colicin V production
MTPIDWFLIAVVLVSMLFGMIRGFLRESIALLGWLVGLWLAWRYYEVLLPYLGGSLTDTELQLWVARLLILLAAVSTAWIIGSLLGYLVQRSGLTLGLDRILGGLFGIVRGAVIIGLAVMLAEAADLRGEDWWKGSKLLPLGEEMSAVLRGYVETGRRVIEDAGEANI